MNSTKSRSLALIFAVIVGMFGVHRFYVGKIGTGVVQLLLTLSFFGGIISGIWVLIDVIMIAVGSFKDSEGKLVANWEVPQSF